MSGNQPHELGEDKRYTLSMPDETPPATLSGTLALGVEAARTVLKRSVGEGRNIAGTPRYEIAPDTWCDVRRTAPDGKTVCRVCFAGTLIATRLEPEPPEDGDEALWSHCDFVDEWCTRLAALDLVRTGRVAEGATKLYPNLTTHEARQFERNVRDEVGEPQLGPAGGELNGIDDLECLADTLEQRWISAIAAEEEKLAAS